MIPLRDDVPSRSFPIVNLTLIGLNAVAFLLELGMGRDVQRFLLQAAVVPVLYTGRDHSLGGLEAIFSSLQPELGLRILVSMFLHGGWLHVIGNLLYLYIFGDNVEDRMGHLRYFVFYLTCGWVAAYAHIWAEPASRLPAIGASGAIAGVLGAYLLLYPNARVVTLLPLGLFAPLVQVPAFFFLGFWFLQQFLLGTLAPPAESGGVAVWAHIGGFVAGFALVGLFQNPKRKPVRPDHWWEDRGRRRTRW